MIKSKEPVARWKRRNVAMKGNRDERRWKSGRDIYYTYVQLLIRLGRVRVLVLLIGFEAVIKCKAKGICDKVPVPLAAEGLIRRSYLVVSSILSRIRFSSSRMFVLGWPNTADDGL